MSYLAKKKFKILELSSNLHKKNRKKILKQFESGEVSIYLFIFYLI